MPLFFSHIQIPIAALERREKGGRHCNQLVRPTPAEAHTVAITCSPSDSVLPGGTKESPRDILRRPKHTWNVEERVTLCVLRRWYPASKEDHCAIFNEHHAATIQAQNPGCLLRKEVLAAQFHEMQRDGEYYEAWRTVMRETKPGDPQNHWQNTRIDLEATAAKIGVDLLRGWDDKLESSIESGQQRLSRKRTRRESSPGGVLGNVLDYSEDEEDQERTCSPRKRAHGPQTPKSERANLQGPSTPTKTNNKRRGMPYLTPPNTDQGRRFYKLVRLPRFGFRVFNNASFGANSAAGFRAGAFIQAAIVPPPLEKNHPTYQREAISHLNRDKEGPTSLISVSQCLIGTLNRGWKLPNASVAVIDLHRAGHVDDIEIAPTASWIYPTKSLTPFLQLDTVYHGNGEWLVWGEIKQEAVVSVFPIDRLLTLFPSSTDADVFRFETIRSSAWSITARQDLQQSPPRLSYSSGQGVGKLLGFFKIPMDLLEDAVFSIVKDWRFSNYRHWRGNGEFLEGVYQGYCGRWEASIGQMWVEMVLGSPGAVPLYV